MPGCALSLSRGLGCQAGKKPCYLRFGHFSRMTLVVEKDEPFDPVNVGFLGPRAVWRVRTVGHLIEEFGFRGIPRAFTAALCSNRFLPSACILALSMLSPPVATASSSEFRFKVSNGIHHDSEGFESSDCPNLPDDAQ